ncbi:MAG: ROK family protein [Spongiibacteraceae bacterium]
MRLGIDLGGTKIEGIVLARDNGMPASETDQSNESVVAQARVATPAQDYLATVDAVVALVRDLEAQVGVTNLPVGVGTPGAVSALTGTMKNCNSTCLNGRRLREDIIAALGRSVRIANDADCFALSEATDGAATGVATVFGVILGTGVGGGIVAQGQLLQGPNAIAGEWGHNVLPGIGGIFVDEHRACYCGRENCIETYLSGAGLAHTYRALGGADRVAAEIAARSRSDAIAAAAIDRYQEQLAYALAQVINLLDPHVIVLGGGLSNIDSLYTAVPNFWQSHVFSDLIATRLLPAQFGDSSGVRGAARLWAG